MPISNRKDLMYQVMENMTGMIRVVDVENNILYMNKSMREEFGDSTGKKCHTMLCKDNKCDICISQDSIEADLAQAKEVNFNGKVYRVIASPATDSDKGRYSIEIFYDITEQKLLEEESRRHYEKLKGDVEFAKQIQRKALPDDGIYWNAIKTYSAYHPSEDLGGDIFDILRVNDDIIAFYIADVSGHGVRSSLMTVFLRQVIRGMKGIAANPVEVIDEILKSYGDLDLDREQYISLIYGAYNMKTRGLSLVNAGHNCLPLVIENISEEEIKLTELEISGMPICSLLSAPNHRVLNLQMEKGDKIMLYTDGITESSNKNGKEFGVDGLKNLIHQLKDSGSKNIAEGVVRESIVHSGNLQNDDMAALILELL